MKRVLLLTALLASGFSAQAQIDTLTEFFTGSPILYSINGAPGFITGNNGLGNKGKYQRFDSSTGLDFNGTMTGALLWIPVKTEAGGGTMDVKVIDFAGGTAGTELASVTVPLSSIDTSFAAYQMAGPNSAYNVAVTFPSPIALTPTSDVVVGVQLPTAAGDSIAIVSNTAGDVTNGDTHAWEIWANDSWNSLYDSWGNNDFHVAMAIFPIVNVSQSGLNEASIHASVYPNPVQTELNIVLDGAATQVDIYTTDGKKVYSQDINGTSATVNVADLMDGMYIYTVFTADGSVVSDTFVKK